MLKKEIKIHIENQQNMVQEAEAGLKILYWFFAYPTMPFSLSDLVENLGISKTTANKAVTALIAEGFLAKEEIGKVWRLTCKIDHAYNQTVKIPFNLGGLYQSGVTQEIHKQMPGARAVVLFGSYRWGKDVEKSDVDIAVEVISDESPKIVRLGTITQLGYRKDVPVNLHIFSRNKVDLNLFANIVNGIVLSGFLEARP